MPRVDDARVYAHTVLFFTFSSPLLSLAAFALRARSSIPSPLQHLFQQTRGGGGEFKKLALRILFFSTTKGNEGKTRLGGSGLRSEGRKEGRERKIWKRCFGGFRAVASCSSSSSSSCLLMPRTSIDFTLRSEIMILTYASCR